MHERVEVRTQLGPTERAMHVQIHCMNNVRKLPCYALGIWFVKRR
jgi:hypothetical protein